MALENIGTTEVTGDKYEHDNGQLEQFCRCIYLDEEGENSLHCKWVDTQGNCALESCIWDPEETPVRNTTWTFTCIFCGKPSTIDPKNMKAHICQTCMDRIYQAEHLPFTCRYCGKTQNSRSQWVLSQVCDDCIPKLYSPNCKNYKP